METVKGIVAIFALLAVIFGFGLATIRALTCLIRAIRKRK